MRACIGIPFETIYNENLVLRIVTFHSLETTSVVNVFCHIMSEMDYNLIMDTDFKSEVTVALLVSVLLHSSKVVGFSIASALCARDLHYSGIPLSSLR